MLSARSRQTGKAAMKKSEKLMVRQASKTVEMFDSQEEVDSAAKAVARLIQKSTHCIAFTGAGISTSAGLGDFRGKSGKWTEEEWTQATGSISTAFNTEAASGSRSEREDFDSEPSAKRLRLADGAPRIEEEEVDEEEEIVDYENLRPTYTHESLSLLLEKGFLHYIISQNCDGLHLLSGVPVEKLSQLHGDVFVEKCEECGKCYSRTFYVPDDVSSQYFEELGDNRKTSIKKPKHALQCSLCGLSHRTGRQCEQKGCRGYLMDTIINFRDNLEEEILHRAEVEACQSDLILCLGTTLTVTPAADLVDSAKGKQPLIICNRQDTEKDDKARVRVYGDCDGFMKQVIHHLLPAQEQQLWEEQREERMKKYEEQRTVKNQE